VQAVVLPGRHRRPVTSPMTQQGGPVECPSLPPWCTYNDEPSCLIAPPVETRPRSLSRRPPDYWQAERRWIAGESNQIMGESLATVIESPLGIACGHGRCAA